MTEDKLLNTLAELKDNFNKKYLTYGGQATKAISQEAEKLQDIPVVGTAADAIAGLTTGMDAGDRSKFISDSTQYLHSAGQMFQQYIQSIAGSRVSQDRIDAFEKLFANPAMSPSEYKAGIDQLLRDVAKEKGIDQSFLKSGIGLGTNQNNAVVPASSGPDLFSQYRADPAYSGWSDEKLRRAIAAQGGK